MHIWILVCTVTNMRRRLSSLISLLWNSSLGTLLHLCYIGKIIHNMKLIICFGRGSPLLQETHHRLSRLWLLPPPFADRWSARCSSWRSRLWVLGMHLLRIVRLMFFLEHPKKGVRRCPGRRILHSFRRVKSLVRRYSTQAWFSYLNLLLSRSRIWMPLILVNTSSSILSFKASFGLSGYSFCHLSHYVLLDFQDYFLWLAVVGVLPLPLYQLLHLHGYPRDWGPRPPWRCSRQVSWCLRSPPSSVFVLSFHRLCSA